MKIFALATVLIVSMSINAATEIVLSKKIKANLREKINRDFSIINSFNFSDSPNSETLKVMGLQTLSSETATNWLNNRVNYVIEEKALSIYNLLIKRVIYVEKSNVIYPFRDSNPIVSTPNDEQLIEDGTEANKGFVVMSNIGAALYMGGKTESKLYGMKISRGLFHPSIKVEINSPRAGIIQIGEGLFALELAVNTKDENAVANSIFRLGTFFHEARHSDGHGKSLGFSHAICPAGHDYEGMPACDENLNGPYTIGKLMISEMAKSCGESSCSEADRESLKLLIIDNASRILKTTHDSEESTAWKDSPEVIE